uniref:Uncharacterized protein n=1 Tax=Parascaris univalens TaxID=6257 RepID=A0A915CIT8_PARUN
MLFDQSCIISLLMSVAFGASMTPLKKRIEAHMKRPPQSGYDRPLNVEIGFYLESLGNFRETQMTFDTDMYMYMSWRDSTLNHSDEQHIMVNDNDIRNQMWLPDLYFANAKTAQFHHVTIPNFSMFIAKDGTIAYSCRVTLTVACNLDLKDYPMDVQNCQIRILSYAYIASAVNVTWFKKSAIQYNPEISLPEYEIISITPAYCNGTYRYAVMPNSYRVDQFSCLVANIRLHRSIGYTLVQSYFPTGLIVIISWVSFWIDRAAVPARVTLSFSTMLSLTTLGNGLRYGLPQVSYAKAIDFWFGGCMLFVFCSLLEFAVVNSYMRQSERNDKLSGKSLRTKGKKNIKEGDSEGGIEKKRDVREFRSDSQVGQVLIENPDQVSSRNLAEHHAQLSRKYSSMALSIDKACRYGFPAAFIVWNIAYWSYYLSTER